MRKTILTAATAALLAGALTPATPALADEPRPLPPNAA